MERMEIRFAGSGGQGLITGTRTLFRALSLEGRLAAQSQSYEPTSRGGFCNADLVVAEDAPDYPLVSHLDYLLALDQVGADKSAELIGPEALVITDDRLVDNPPEGGFRRIDLPLTDTAIAAGSHRAANMVALGVLIGLSGLCKRETLEEAVRRDSPPKFKDLNLKAIAEGFRLADAVTAPA